MLMEDNEEETQQKRLKKDALVSAQMKLMLSLAPDSIPKEKEKRLWLNKKAEILQGVDNDRNLFKFVTQVVVLVQLLHIEWGEILPRKGWLYFVTDFDCRTSASWNSYKNSKTQENLIDWDMGTQINLEWKPLPCLFSYLRL